MGRRRGNGEGTVEKLPSGSFRAVISKTVGGKRVRESATFPTRAEAVAWKKGKAEPTAAGTVGDWLATWLDLHRAKVSVKAYYNDFHTVRTHIRTQLGPVRLRALSALRVEQWLADLHAAGVSQCERAKAGRVLRKCLNAAVRAKQITASPLADIPMPAFPAPDTHSLTADELARVLAAADRLGRGCLFRVWADAGLRPQEIAGLQWQDWDADRCELSVRRAVCPGTGKLKDTKTKESRRTIDLSSGAAAALARHKPADARPDAPVFPTGRGRHYWTSHLGKRVVSRVFGAAGVKGTAYTMRHTMASLMLQAGVSVRVVSERLGHSDVALTLRVYCHSLPGAGKKAAEVMGLLIDRATTGTNLLGTPDRPNLPHAGPTAA